MDKATWTGVLVAVGGIVLGLLLEGGNLGQILQPTAAMIVFGGTLGAILIQFPLNAVVGALQRLAQVFFEQVTTPQRWIQQLVGFANKARREGMISLDSEMEAVEEPFLKRSLMLAIDGTEPQELRKMMELQIANQAERDERYPAVFESAGGFSPTIGIIGAVLGLIQVMQHLDKIDEVGRGIAVAFVATIYGLITANIICLPMGSKLKHRLKDEVQIKQMIIEGLIAIQNGENPHFIEQRLRSYLQHNDEKKAK